MEFQRELGESRLKYVGTQYLYFRWAYIYEFGPVSGGLLWEDLLCQ